MPAISRNCVQEEAARSVLSWFGKPRGSSVDLWVLTQLLGVDSQTVAGALGVDRAVVSRWLWGVRPLPRQRQRELNALVIAALGAARAALEQGRGEFADPVNRTGVRIARFALAEIEKLALGPSPQA